MYIDESTVVSKERSSYITKHEKNNLAKRYFEEKRRSFSEAIFNNRKGNLTEPYKLVNFTSQSSALVPQFYNVFIMTEVDGNEDILNDLMLPVQTMILKINNSQLILIW